MHSSVDNLINSRVRRLKSLSNDFAVRTGEISNRSKSYEVHFDFDYILCEDMEEDILKEIREGTFYTDKVVGKSFDLENTPVYIDEEKFINKIKLKTKWKKCIESIVVNDRV